MDRDDHIREHGLLDRDAQERIEGRDPVTGERDPSRDGTITAAVPVVLVDRFQPVPAPPEHPGWIDELAVARAPDVSTLVVPTGAADAERIMRDAIDRYDDARGYEPRRLWP